MQILQDVDIDGDIEATSFVKTGGTSSQFLKADGSVDSNSYITSIGNTQRSDEEIRDVAAAQWVNGTNTTVVVDDAANTIKINTTGGSSGIDGSGTAKRFPKFTDSDTLADSNMFEAAGGEIMINTTTEYSGLLNIYQTNTDPSLQLITNDAGSSAGPIIKMVRDSSSPADSDLLGGINFHGNDSAGTEVIYSKVEGYIQDTTVGSALRGGVKLSSLQNGTHHTNLETVGTRGYLYNTWYLEDQINILGTASLSFDSGMGFYLDGDEGTAGQSLVSGGTGNEPQWADTVHSDTTEGGTGSVNIGNMVKITAAAHTSLGAGADADTLYIIVG